MNRVLETETFAGVLVKCERDERRWIDKVKDQLKRTLDVGKPLRFDWFREKKLKGRRLFYIINRETCTALLIAFGTKKEQVHIIETVLREKEHYFSITREN